MIISTSTLQDNVCNFVVWRDLCIGCGVCAGICPADNLVMGWTSEGLLQPFDQGKCLSKCHRCVDVCPFINRPENENTLAKACFGHISGIKHTPETGFYLKAYVGHAGGEYRRRGASGGMASWFLASLLENKEVERVICVRPNKDPKSLFAYMVADNAEEVRAGAKSAYYPVELSQAIHMVLQEPHRYAVIGLPCTLKALRLAMLVDDRLGDRIAFMAGLICGQTKSRAFAEYLTRSHAMDPGQVCSLSFREKDASRPASNYSAKATTSDKIVCIPWIGIYGKTWLSGEFTPRPCRFCDDIFAEVADIAFMDAWLPEYVKDSEGTSIVLTRSNKAQQLIEGALARGEISLQPIAISKVIASQAGVVREKRNLLAHRLWIAGRNGVRLQKRVSPVRPSWYKKLILKARENLRAASYEAFCTAISTSDDWIKTYHSLMLVTRRRLNVVLIPSHYYGKVRAAVSRLKHFFNSEKNI